MIGSEDRLTDLATLTSYRSTAFNGLSSDEQNNIKQMLGKGITAMVINEQLDKWQKQIDLLNLFYEKYDELDLALAWHKLSPKVIINNKEFSFKQMVNRNFRSDIQRNSFFSLSKESRQFFANFAQQGITKEQLEKKLNEHFYNEYWRNLRKILNTLNNLRTNYNFNDKLRNNDAVDDFLTKLMSEKRETSYSQLKQSNRFTLAHLFKNKVTIGELSKYLQEAINQEKSRLWATLLKINNKELLINLIKNHEFSDPIIIDGNDYRTELDAFVNFIEQPGSKNKSFAELTPEQKKQFLGTFFENVVTVTKLNKGLLDYNRAKLASYWNNLKTKLSRVLHLKNSYGLTTLMIDNQNYFRQLQALSTTQTKSIEKVKTEVNLLQLFNQGISIMKIDEGLKKFADEVKTRLWNVLKRHRKQLSAFVKRKKLIQAMLIGNKNYHDVFQKFLQFIHQQNNQGKTFNDLTSTEKEQFIKPFFDQGINDKAISELLAKLESKLQTEIEGETRLKNKKKKTQLAIGLGVGLGVPVVIGGVGFGYWLTKK